MDLGEEILLEQKAKLRRLTQVRTAWTALRPNEKEEVLAEFYLEVKTERGRPSNGKAERPKGPPGKKVDLAEKYVFEHPDGVSSDEVGQAIGQDGHVAESTLRYVMADRHTLERRDGLWFPKGSRPKGSAKKLTLRDAILKVLSDGVARGTADIYAETKKAIRTARKGSVGQEVAKMRKDGLVVAKPSSGRGGLYSIPVQPAQPEATNGASHASQEPEDPTFTFD